MSEKFDPDPVDKDAEDPKKAIKEDRPQSQLNQELEDTFPLPIRSAKLSRSPPGNRTCSMTDDTERRTLEDKAFDAARETVDAATHQVDKIGQHFKQKLEAAKRSETYVEMLKDVTKAAPLAMLAVAFVGGMLFARRR